MAIVCIICSPGITSGSYNPQEMGQGWKPLHYLRLPFRKAAYAVPRLPGLQQGSHWLCRGSHAAPQPMEGVVSPHFVSLHALDRSSSQIWGLHAASSASLQGLVTLTALVASAPMHPYGPNQLKGVGSGVLWSSGRGSGCEVGGPDAAGREPMRAKGTGR